ncbi:hypothetical protein MKZ38_005486 [Zalerion maritima]|uniref:Enoyl reductase (ER) domain-containing protein n=1 Tax=Zalerion maritima TaxID=339359 RepID=A0AAD5RWW9_9PEZI|nr:hypothetical protein MKZ38_005486 [Zalerion maritima]
MTTAQTTTNKAAFLPGAGSNLVAEERPVPTPEPGQVSIRNHVIGVNPIDWKRQAWGFLIKSFPTILGADVSGTIVSMGTSVTSFQPGDRVLALSHGIMTGEDDHGAYQEFTVALASATSKLPPNIDFHQGAAMPTAVGTAAMALFHCLGFPRPSTSARDATNKGPVVLVWGAASSVGIMTVQLARLAGLTVYATASEMHHDRLRNLGAEVVLDYRSPTVAEDVVSAAHTAAGKGIANVVDCISTPETLGKCLDVLKLSSPEGKLKLAHTTPWPEKELARPSQDEVENEQVEGQELWVERKELSAWLYHEMLPQWLEKGDIVPLSHRVVEGEGEEDGLEERLQFALDELKKGGVRGEKLVVEV